jgi:hypothetical protein
MLEKLISETKKVRKEWLDQDDLFEEYGITKSTQAKMRMSRTLPYHKIGKYVRYKRRDIDKMFDDAKVC